MINTRLLQTLLTAKSLTDDPQVVASLNEAIWIVQRHTIRTSDGTNRYCHKLIDTGRFCIHSSLVGDEFSLDLYTLSFSHSGIHLIVNVPASQLEQLKQVAQWCEETCPSLEILLAFAGSTQWLVRAQQKWDSMNLVVAEV